MSETPAETIRRAAALMRERAEAAPKGPWRMKRGHLGGHPQYISDPGGFTVAECWEDAETAPAASVHIASWHPLVALAVADWLEAEAVQYDELAASPYGAEGAAFVAGDFGGDVDPALKAARAYLGEPS